MTGRLILRTTFLGAVDQFLNRNPRVNESSIGFLTCSNRDLIERVRTNGNAELATLERVLELMEAHEDKKNPFTFPMRGEAA